MRETVNTDEKSIGRVKSSATVKDGKKIGSHQLPALPISTIWMISFGFLGVQMAFSLQSSNMGRIFQTIGADPTKLGFFFILPPLAGLVVQPLVGYFSDRTWIPKLGRRIPYLLVGAVVAVIVMCLLPNAGSFGFGFGSMTALTFGAVTILFMDLSSNVAMQPFKMMVADMVNEEQKGFAYAVQSFLSNSGAVLACIFPFVLTALGVSNSAPKGVVPQSVVVSFYSGAVILIVCSLFTVFKVKEYPPDEYAVYHGIQNQAQKEKRACFNCSSMRRKSSGRLLSYNFSAGWVFNICGRMERGQWPKTLGMQWIRQARPIRKQPTGSAFYQVCIPLPRYFGLLC